MQRTAFNSLVLSGALRLDRPIKPLIAAGGAAHPNPPRLWSAYERAPTLGGGFARARTMAVAFSMSKGLSLSCPLLCLCASDLKAPVLLKATFRKPTLLGRPDFAVPHYLGILSFGGSRVIHVVVGAPKAEPSQFIARTQSLLPLL